MALNKFGKKKNKDKYSNTFYREAVTGGFSKEPYTIKKFSKHAFKTAKWATFGFLAVTAIWGCVDGFIVQTNPVVSRGMEVYMTHDDVLPNLYNTVPEAGYRIEGAEINPLVFDEEYEDIANFNAEDTNENSDVAEAEGVYISEDSMVSAEDIKKNNDYEDIMEDGYYDPATEQEQYNEMIADLVEDGLVTTTEEEDAAIGLRIIPMEIINPYISLFTSEFWAWMKEEEHQNEDQNALWNSLVDANGEGDLIAPKSYVTVNEEDDVTLTPIEAPFEEKNWETTNPIDSTYTNEHFNSDDIFINMTEFNNPMGYLSLEQYEQILILMDKEIEEAPTYQQYRDFQEARYMPDAFKQISTTDYNALNTITYMDYEGGNELYVDDYASDGVAEVSLANTGATTQTQDEWATDGIRYLSGATFVQDTDYDVDTYNDLPDEEKDTYEAYNKHAYAAFVVEDTYNGGLGTPEVEAATYNAYGRLNLATWTETELEELGADEATIEKYEGEFKYREDVLKYLTNYFSFINGSEWSIQQTAEVAFANGYGDQTDPVAAAQAWLAEGADIVNYLPNLTGDEATAMAIGQGNDIAIDETSYTIDVPAYIEAGIINNITDLAATEGEGYIDYYSGTELTFGTSYIVVGHQQEEGFQVVPTAATLEYAMADRGSGWEDDPQNTEIRNVDDPKIQNAGWTFMDNNGDIVRFYDTTIDMNDDGEFNQEDIDIINDMSVSEYQAILDSEGSEIKAGFTAQSLTPGMGEFANHEEVVAADAYDQTIDTMVEMYTGRSDQYSSEPANADQANAPPVATYANYGTFQLTEDVEVDLTSVTGFSGLSELDETAISPYEDEWGSQYAYNNTTDDANDAITAAGNTSYNEDHQALVTWAEAWAISPFYGAFVWPLSKLAIWVQGWFPPSWGIWGILVGIFIIVFGLRLIATLFSFGQTRKQAKMQEVQFQVSKINAKYAAHEGNKAMKRRKQMEVMALYRKAGVNPMGSIGSIFTTMPVFLAIWTIINALTIYKVATVGTVSLAISPLTGIFNMAGTAGVFIAIGGAIITVQIVSAKLPQWLSQKRQGIRHLDEQTKAAMKKQNKTTTIMVVIFVIMGLTVPALLGIYWMYSGLFTILQNLIQHWIALRKSRMAGIVKEKKAWKVSLERKVDSFKNWTFWDTPIIPAR